MRRRVGCRGESFGITRRHPESQRRRGTSQLVTLYPSLCQQDPTERSLAFARDDSSASLNTWPYRAVSLSFVSSWLGAWGFRWRKSIASPENLSPRAQESWHGTEWVPPACQRPHNSASRLSTAAVV